MSETLARAKSYWKTRFTERQIYVRSKDALTYIPLSVRTQIAFVVLAAALALWVGFASVNVIFGDSIAAQRARDFAAQRLAYENELQRLQIAYDELSGQITLTRDWFSETTETLEKKHNALSRTLERHAAISAVLADRSAVFARTAQRGRKASGKTELVARRGVDLGGTTESRTHQPAAAREAVALTALPETAPDAALPHLPDDVQQRIGALETGQQDLFDALEENIDGKIAEFESVIAETEVLDADSFIARVLPEASRAMGGPYIPLKDAASTDMHRQLYRITSGLDRLSELEASLTHIPLAVPIHNYSITSDFGARRDPFRKRIAFHAGVDFGAVIGTPVYATLPGIITQAGQKGPYGLVVEIDHGNGFRTRYGHLARARVKIGERVDFQERIGDAGNSGRSTGPHLHYEIWYDGQVRDPRAFLDAGRGIFRTDG